MAPFKIIVVACDYLGGFAADCLGSTTNENVYDSNYLHPSWQPARNETEYSHKSLNSPFFDWPSQNEESCPEDLQPRSPGVRVVFNGGDEATNTRDPTVQSTETATGVTYTLEDDVTHSSDPFTRATPQYTYLYLPPTYHMYARLPISDWDDIKIERIRDEGRLAQSKLLQYLMQNRDSFDSSFWGGINQWQIERYKQDCEAFLQTYKQATKAVVNDKENVKLITEALERATERAQRLKRGKKPTWQDVFVTRCIYDDPDLKALIYSDHFAPERRKEMVEAAEKMASQQPLFPPYCYTLIRS